MEFNREEKSLLVMGLLALQEVTGKSNGEGFDKQKFDSKITSLINKINGK